MKGPEDLGRQQQNPCWLRLCSQIQIAEATGKVREMYDDHPRSWLQTEPRLAHYSELYARENVVSDDAPNPIDSLPVLEELDSNPTRIKKQ